MLSSETKSSAPECSPSSVLLEDLSSFFDVLDLSKDKAEAYVAGCAENNIKNVRELREIALLQYLREKGLPERPL